MMKLVATMPIKPYLLKFVRRIENLQEGEALLVKKDGGLVAYILGMLLEQKMKVDHSYIPSLKQRSDYTELLYFQVSSRRQTFNNFYLSRSSISVFNKSVYRLFHEFLLSRILIGVAAGRDEKEIIYEFIAELNIEDDISFDAIKKANYRLRKSKKIPSLNQQSSICASNG